MDYIIHTTDGGELYHHGVLGMKWGVRRYQNPDGTRTAEGKRRERYGLHPRRERREIKKEYKRRKDESFAEYERRINDIEKPYKRGQMLSDEDVKREKDAEDRFRKDNKNARAKYLRDKRTYKSDIAIRKQNGKEAIKGIGTKHLVSVGLIAAGVVLSNRNEIAGALTGRMPVARVLDTTTKAGMALQYAGLTKLGAEAVFAYFDYEKAYRNK